MIPQMTDNHGNAIDWDNEYRRHLVKYTYLLLNGYLTHGEYKLLSAAAEKLIRHIFGPRASPVAEVDEIGIAWHGFEMLQTMSRIEDLAGFYLQGKPKPAKGMLLSERVNPLALRGGDDMFETMHFNAEHGALKIKCAPNHNPSGADITVVARLYFKVLMKLNRKLPIYDAELAFAEWARAFGSPLMGKDKSELIPGIVASYKKYRASMIELSRAFHTWEVELIEANGEENEAEDIKRMMSILTADPDPADVPKGGASRTPPPTGDEVAESDVGEVGRGVPTRRDKENSDSDERPSKSESFHRFKVEWFTSGLKVTDMENFPNEPYFITPANGNAAKAALMLIRDYDAGNEQTHKSSRRWIGAFQSGRGAATRFRKEQIFKLPKWSAEKGHFLPNQFDGRWRLWTDKEMLLAEEERLANFKAAHPHGYGVG